MVHNTSHAWKTFLGLRPLPFACTEHGITKGGNACLVNLICTGQMPPAQKDLNECAHKEDGGHWWPCIPANQPQVAGQLCFRNMEMTGSSCGSKKSKVSIVRMPQKL